MTKLERFNEVVQEELCLDAPPSLDARIADIADSMERISLTIALEDTFNIEIPDDVAENMGTIRDAYDFVDKNTPHYTETPAEKKAGA